MAMADSDPHIRTVPGGPPALVPQDGLSLPPSWGRFFGANRESDTSCDQAVFDGGGARLLDEWRRVQHDLPNRPAAIRRLVEIGLKAKGK